MMIRSIGHAALRVTDMERSVDFYTRVLGGEKVFEGYDGGALKQTYVKLAEGAYVELFTGGDGLPEKSAGRAGFMHLCLTVDDIREAEKRVRESGWPAGDVRKGKYGNYQLWVRDPDENEIELMQILPDFLDGRG